MDVTFFLKCNFNVSIVLNLKLLATLQFCSTNGICMQKLNGMNKMNSKKYLKGMKKLGHLPKKKLSKKTQFTNIKTLFLLINKNYFSIVYKKRKKLSVLSITQVITVLIILICSFDRDQINDGSEINKFIRNSCHGFYSQPTEHLL